MPAPTNPSGGPRDGSGQGRGRGLNAGAAPFQPGNATSRESKPRGRGRGAGTSSSRRGLGRGGTSNVLAGTQKQNGGDIQSGSITMSNSPFAQLKGNNATAPKANAEANTSSQFGKPSASTEASRTRGGFGASSISHTTFGSSIDRARDPRRQRQKALGDTDSSSIAPVDDAQLANSYQERYEKLKIDRAREREQAIRDGQMADPNQPTSLNQAITPVGTCTSMCPDFERVERIVQKMVDKSEKYLHPETGTYQIMESKMLKRFRRSAAGYDAQLPSDIRTPHTLLQTMNYLIRHVIDGPEPLELIHKFVWDRTRSIRNDFSIQQLTQEDHVRMAVACLERIARFHIISLHLLSSPDNEEPFDHHQEREQLNNTLLSLMYYYDDNQGRNMFPHEEEFRAYYIVFAIHDQRPDLETRVQNWPQDLLRSPRVQVALELFAAASNAWEYQGALDEKRPNAIAQGLYTRFFELVGSPSVSYLMACVAEIYFNTVRQTAIRSIWKAYCRTPLSQQHKNDEWTLNELTDVLHFDDDTQTATFCEEQGLSFAENSEGELYLNWGNQPIDSVEFQPSSAHTFSEHLVECKRGGRNLVALILGLNIRQATNHGMIDGALLSSQATSQEEPVANEAEDDALFVSEDENEESTTQADANFNPSLNTSNMPASSSHFSLPGADTQRPPATSPPSSSIFGAPSSPNPFQQLSAPNSQDTKTSSPSFTTSPQGFTPLPAISSNPFAPQVISPRQQSVMAPQVDSTQANSPFQPPSLNPFAQLSPAEPVSRSNLDNSNFPSQHLQFSKPSDPPSSSSSQPFSISAAIANGKTVTPSNQNNGNVSIFSAVQSQKSSQAPLFSFNPPKDNQSAAPRQSAASEPLPTFSFNAPESDRNVTSQPPTTHQGLPTFSFTPPKDNPQATAQPSTSTPLNPFAAMGASNAVQNRDTKQSDQTGHFTFNAQSETTKPLSSTVSPAPSSLSSSANLFTNTSPDASKPSLNSISSKPNGHTTSVTKESHISLVAAPSRDKDLNQEPSTFRAPPTASDLPSDSGSFSAQTSSLKEPVASPAAREVDDVGEKPLRASELLADSQLDDRQLAWIQTLNNVADARRKAASSNRKRPLKAPESEPSSPEDTLKHVPPKKTKEALQPRKSLARASIAPLPTLPILDEVKRLTERKQPSEETESASQSQIDEDELLLSAARIAAESLKNGPSLLDEMRYSTLNGPTLSSGFSKSLSSAGNESHTQSPYSRINGYNVALAPDSPLGLGRTMSRTEQRIRLTGGKGLAYKPLDLVSKKESRKGKGSQ